jgi:HAD superfamily phosphatase (TIGR01668 family)
MTRLAARETPLGTFIQSLGRLPTLLRSMDPTWSLASLAEINPDFVSRHRITGLIWDVDGTLTAYHYRDLLPSVAGPFAALRALPSVRHAILSNAPEWRVSELGRMFPTIPVIRGYAQDGRILSRRLLGSDDSWTSEELAARLAAGAVPLRKPSAELVRLAVTELGGDAEGVVMVGDQHFTDIAGANLGGIRSIKIPNPAGASFPTSIRVMQRLEALLLRVRPPGWRRPHPSSDP